MSLGLMLLNTFTFEFHSHMMRLELDSCFDTQELSGKGLLLLLTVQCVDLIFQMPLWDWEPGMPNV